jgi:hypothetical protein
MTYNATGIAPTTLGVLFLFGGTNGVWAQDSGVTPKQAGVNDAPSSSRKQCSTGCRHASVRRRS